MGLRYLLNCVNAVVCSDIEGFYLPFCSVGNNRINTDRDSTKGLSINIRQNDFVIKFHLPTAHLSSLPTHLSAGVEKRTATDNENQHGSNGTLIFLFKRECVPKKSEDIGKTES